MIITPTLVIFLIVVFVSLYAFLRTVDRRKWLTLVISLVLTPIVYFYLFYPFINIISNYHHQKYFNSEAWKEKPALRYEMLDNILESDTLIGLSSNEITKRLGTYEWLSWDDSIKAHDSTKWNFGLGIEPGAFNNQKECLEIEFKDGVVKALVHYKEDISYE